MNLTVLERELAYMVYFGGILPENFDRKIIWEKKVYRVKMVGGMVVFCQDIRTKKIYKDNQKKAV